MNYISEYLWIIDKELRLINPQSCQREELLGRPSDINDIATRLIEIAKNSTVLRCGNHIGHLTDATQAFESDGSHTNLVRAIVSYALDFLYGLECTNLNYTRREIDEAILIHDLPENIIGDIPDNGTRDEGKKQRAENDYYAQFFQLYGQNSVFGQRVSRLLHEMNTRSSHEGRLIYTADKLSAIIMMLCYDSLGMFPHADRKEPSMSKINQTEIETCEINHGGYILLSELWTVDYLIGRKLVRFDDTGIFTAILIMITLMTHGCWYQWRETNY